MAEDGRLTRMSPGRTLASAPHYDSAVERWLRDVLDREGSLTLDDYVIGEDELQETL